MTCDLDFYNGDEAVLLIRDDLDTIWQIFGGVKSRDLTTDNPVEETTSSSTIGSNTTSQYTGYSTVSLSVSGAADGRTGRTKTIRGVEYSIAPITRLDKLANEGNRCGKFKVIYPYKDIEGEFNITSYGDSGDTPGLLNFTATLQNKGQITPTYYPA